MTAKEYLSQFRRLRQEINKRMEEIERLRSQAERVTPVLTGMPRGGGGTDFTDIVDTLLEIVDDMEARTRELKSIANGIMDAINAVRDAAERQCLLRRYVIGQNWVQIAREMDYSLDGIYKLHRRALERIEVEDED